MTPVAALTGLLIMGGLVVLLAGCSRSWPERRGQRSASLAEAWARASRRPPGRAGQRRDLVLAGSLAAGVVVALLTGWAVALVVAPILALGLPYLLVLPKARDVELLEALDRWVRALAASMTTGRSVTDAIRISRRTAPPALTVEVGRLVDRLNSRWDTTEALRGFADRLDSPDADGVVAALILAGQRGANGASVTLSALADSIQDQLRGRRAIETERAKPYVVVRQVTIISLVTLAGMFVLSPGFFAAYTTPIGQVILSVLVVLYLGSLILLRRKAQTRPRERILVGARS
jgi:tight adherence protein B